MAPSYPALSPALHTITVPSRERSSCRLRTQIHQWCIKVNQGLELCLFLRRRRDPHLASLWACYARCLLKGIEAKCLFILVFFRI
ncbi:hypothetical protein RIF29_29114 [Crotalaria pallida]|uniref:Uncharacterized protein n=1 Tax=Crotalaria pallida TaxID=3830 RepID=A0AAN9EG45_CROPI